MTSTMSEPLPAEQLQEQLVQEVLALGQQQGWGATANTSCVSQADGAARRAERRGSVKVTDPEVPSSNAPQLMDGADGATSGTRKTLPGACGGGGAAFAAAAPPCETADQCTNAISTLPAAPAGATSRPACAALPNTNGVCENIVTAARFNVGEGGPHPLGRPVPVCRDISAPQSAVEAGDPAAWRPFRSRSASDCSEVVPPAGTQCERPLDCAHYSGGATNGPLALATTSAMAVQPTATTEMMQQLLSEAREVYTAAESRLLDDGLALCEDWMGTRDLFFAAGSLFAAAGVASTAARCLLHATFINRAFHNDEEALMTLTMSVEQLKRSHPRIAVASLLQLASCYVRQELRFQAARCYRDAAEILENVLEEKTEAVVQYQAALDMYEVTRTCAVATARDWDRQQRRAAAARLERANNVSPNCPSADSSTCRDLALSTGSKTDVKPGESAVAVSATRTARSETSNPEAKSDRDSLEPRAPPNYRMNSKVQRSLADACRWRIAVLLAYLGRYKELQEVVLACAASVPSTLPKTKFLLYATLCVLTRGVAPPAEVDSSAPPPVAVESPNTTFTVSPANEKADSIYFDSLYAADKFFLALQDEDRTFQRGKENALVRAILEANRTCSLTSFDDAVRTYKGYATTEPCVVFDILITQCRRSLLEHIERFE